MKKKITQKAIKEKYGYIVKVGYCQLQHLLYFENPDYYTCGVYGWKSDIYHLNNNLALSTGYSPFGNIDVNYEFTKSYDLRAEKIVCNRKMSYESKKAAINELLNEFVSEVMK